MAILPLVIGVDNPQLRVKTVKVGKVTKEIKQMIRDMQETMVEANGIGLAAPQIGSNVKLCIAPVGGKMTAMMNPEITWKSEEQVVDEEGCLSLPGTFVQVPRAVEIIVTFDDEKGQQQERKLQNLEARVVQHETDHLNAKLITDYR